jgi:hypothetical protein
MVAAGNHAINYDSVMEARCDTFEVLRQCNVAREDAYDFPCTMSMDEAEFMLRCSPYIVSAEHVELILECIHYIDHDVATNTRFFRTWVDRVGRYAAMSPMCGISFTFDRTRGYNEFEQQWNNYKEKCSDYQIHDWKMFMAMDDAKYQQCEYDMMRWYPVFGTNALELVKATCGWHDINEHDIQETYEYMSNGITSPHLLFMQRRDWQALSPNVLKLILKWMELSACIKAKRYINTVSEFWDDGFLALVASISLDDLHILADTPMEAMVEYMIASQGYRWNHDTGVQIMKEWHERR